MKSPGLRLRVLLTLLVPLGIFAPVTLASVYDAIDSRLAKQVDVRGLALAREIATVVVDQILTGERYAAERRMSDIVATQPDAAYAFVVDAHDRVVAHTFRGGFPLDLLRAHTVSRKAGSPLVVELGDREVHDMMSPVLGGDAGYVHVGVSTGPAKSFSRDMLLRLSLIGLGVVVTGLAVTISLTSRLGRRIERVARAAESVGQGDLDARVGDKADDELGRMGEAFDRMAERLCVAREERERTFQRLAQSEKLVAVGRLAAGVAHEISNPLTGVLHCVDSLRKNDREEGKRRSYYDLMTDGVGRAQRVVRHLLEYSRQHDLETTEVDLDALVRRVLALLAPSFEKASVQATFSFESELPPIRVDPHGIEQVLMNLLLNAIDAMPNGGKVEVDVRRVGAECRIRVADTGCGIPSDSLDQIFDPFFTTKGGSKGSGLGLSVSLGIVERHGGRIGVDSTPGQSAVFEVFMPLDHAKTPGEAKP